MRYLAALVALLLAAPAHAAPRTPYGADILMYVFGRPTTLVPQDLATPADATLQTLVYERLYRIDGAGALTPELASGPPTIDGRTVTVPVRTDVVLHDGRLLAAPMIADALRRLGASDARSTYVGALVTGLTVRDDALVFELAAAHVDFVRLLASAHAGVAVPAVGRAGFVGSGPFSFTSKSARGTIQLAPFLQHRRGRPFADRVRMRPHASRFGAAALAKGDEAAFVFGVPDTKGRARNDLAKAAPQELLVLAVGAAVRAERPSIARTIDLAIDRRRLTRRFLEADATPARRLVARAWESSEEAAATDRVTLSLLVSRDARAGHRFAERLQLDLLRAGITVRIERLAPERLEARRRAGEYELLLDSLVSGVAPSARPSATLHTLWSYASAMGRPDAIDPRDAERVDLADDAAKTLGEIEAAMRARLGLVPIARRVAAIALDETLEDAHLLPTGAIDLADAFRKSR